MKVGGLRAGLPSAKASACRRHHAALEKESALTHTRCLDQAAHFPDTYIKTSKSDWHLNSCGANRCCKMNAERDYVKSDCSAQTMRAVSTKLQSASPDLLSVMFVQKVQPCSNSRQNLHPACALHDDFVRRLAQPTKGTSHFSFSSGAYAFALHMPWLSLSRVHHLQSLRESQEYMSVRAEQLLSQVALPL